MRLKSTWRFDSVSGTGQPIQDPEVRQTCDGKGCLGDRLAQKGVIVTNACRLGPLRFVALPELTQGQEKDVSLLIGSKRFW